MPNSGFEPATPTSQRPQTHALERAATAIGLFIMHLFKIIFHWLSGWLRVYRVGARCSIVQWHLSANVGITSLVSMFGLVSSVVIPRPAPLPLRDRVRAHWYFGFLETALSWLLEAVSLPPRGGDCGLSTIKLRHTAGKESKSVQI